jgi:hypothetical protein
MNPFSSPYSALAYALFSAAHVQPGGLAHGPVAAAQAATAATPTVSEFLNADNVEYLISGTPAGMKPFTVAGIPITYTNDVDGTDAKVWVTAENQVIIAYQGTDTGTNFITNPGILTPQLIADLISAGGGNSPAEIDALGFARTVVLLANWEGYSTSNIFVSGHSLGGIEAQYVASQTGLAGIAFAPTGLPASDITSSGSNFVNILNYGDPVGSYASDIAGEQPFGPAYVAGGGKIPHYGNVVIIGEPSDQTTMSSEMAPWGTTLGADAGVLLDWALLLLAHHLPGVYAHDLGVTLNPSSALVDGGGNQTGPVWSIGADTIPQLLNDAAAKGVLTHG